MSVNHLYTADRTLTRSTKLYCLFEEGKQWRTEVSSERSEPSPLVGAKLFSRSQLHVKFNVMFDVKRQRKLCIYLFLFLIRISLCCKAFIIRFATLGLVGEHVA